MEIALTEELVVKSENGTVTLKDVSRVSRFGPATALRITIQDGGRELAVYLTSEGLSKILTECRDQLIDIIEEY